MHRSIWVIALFLPYVLADKGNGGGDEDDEAATSPMSSPSSTTTTTTTAVSSVFPAQANSSSTSTSMYPSVTPPAALHFSTPLNATTCTPAKFQWQVIPPSLNTTNMTMHLLITNDGVQQAAPSSWPASTTATMYPARRQLPSNVVSRNITNKTSMASGSFSWPAVTVPEGWYILEGSHVNAGRSGIASQSGQFFVSAGPNMTCVYPDVSTVPSSDVHTQLSPGALAGTVIGTVVGLAALLGAFALPRLWRKNIPGHQAWKEKRRDLYHLF